MLGFNNSRYEIFLRIRFHLDFTRRTLQVNEVDVFLFMVLMNERQDNIHVLVFVVYHKCVAVVVNLLPRIIVRSRFIRLSELHVLHSYCLKIVCNFFFFFFQKFLDYFRRAVFGDYKGVIFFGACQCLERRNFVEITILILFITAFR